MISERDTQLHEIQLFREKMKQYQDKAFTIVNLLCNNKTKDPKAMHEAYKILRMSTAELRTMMESKTVEDIKDALKIVEMALLKL